MGIADDIKAIEEEIAKTKYNKATQYHIGRLKAKLSRLRDEQVKRGSGGGGGVSFDVKRSGHATCGIIGLPSVGKSTLLNAMTGTTQSAVAAYEFTTLTVIPGLLEYRGAKIQILDMPGIIKGAAKGKGRGREVLSVARGVDLVILVLDILNPDTLPVVVHEVEEANIRLNKKKPDVHIYRTERGGVEVRSTVTLTHVDEQYVKDIAGEFKVTNASIVIRKDLTPDELIDSFAANRVYIPGILVLNKIDGLTKSEVKERVDRLRALGWEVIPTSADRGTGIEAVKEAVFQKLRFIRVYLRPQGGETDFKDPLVVKDGSDVGAVCDMLHRDMRRNFRYSLVWGKSAKFPGQTVGLDHVLKDEDVLTLILRRR
ncbi:MAG TPA: GTP-binding protein [Candidatus Thermoplasmatota archaeon]|nr:GTP-binding protein [Candidatus Thermoplasmatota archaeon]